MNNKQWPSVGDKITFRGTHVFWFKNIVEDANTLLELGKEYTIKRLELASSWCGVILDEFPDTTFALSFFNYEAKLTTQEVMDDRYIFTSLEELKERDLSIDMTYTKPIDSKVNEKIREMFNNPTFRKVMENLSKND